MNHTIITIARQFGSGGHEIAKRLAERLEIPLYDRNLVEMAAAKMGQSPLHVEKVDEAALSWITMRSHGSRTRSQATGCLWATAPM